ncbi:hypothetical protein [Streptomyces sp. NPDC048521]|uniref:hypothetical protein n=1 Tax=Streptomyces sp. NPDC048521 TaxID=3365566 RepID=UPI003710B400
MPLPGRAARVLEMAALKEPGEAEARELAGWADPRATAFFFRSGPAATWLPLLREHAPHLLAADETVGAWPAAPFLERLATASPATARPWLADHAVQLAAAGPLVLGALLRLADAGALTPADIQRLLPHVTIRPPAEMPAEEASLERRLMASWAGNLPMPARDGDWLLVVEALLKDTVDLGHAGYLAYHAARRRAHAGHEPLPELTEVLRREWAARLPDHDVIGLLRELVLTVHAGGPFRWARPVRNALAGLLRRDIEASVRQSWHASVDLDEVRVLDERVFLGPVLEMGPLLARAVLDLAAADAGAGLPLAERTRAWPRIAAADEHLHNRVLAAHLAAHPPAADTDVADAGEWWDRAVEATVRLLAGRPTPEGARLAALVLEACPPERAAGLHQRALAALGPAPAAEELDRVLPAAGVDEVGRRDEPLASWLRIWAWSPVLPACLLADFAPLLAGLRRLEPAGPPARGPPSARGRAITPPSLWRTCWSWPPQPARSRPPPPWPAPRTRAPPATRSCCSALWRPPLPPGPPTSPRSSTPWPGRSSPRSTSPPPRVPRVTPAPSPPVRPRPSTPRSPSAAPCPLRPTPTFPTRRSSPAGRGQLCCASCGAPVAASPVTCRPSSPVCTPSPSPSPAPPPTAHAPATPALRAAGPAGEDEGLPAGLLETHPAVRALDCLLDYATGQATADGTMPGDVLRLLADVLAARGGDEAIATVIGAHLPLLHRRATAFTAAHPELYALHPQRPSPAAAWLERGGPDPLLLAALDRGQLLAAVRANAYGAARRVAFALLLQEPPTCSATP